MNGGIVVDVMPFCGKVGAIGTGGKLDVRNYSDRERTEHDEVSLPLCRRLAALLDIDPANISEGDEIPLTWSSILFPSVARQGDIGDDGHPRLGDFIPDLGFPRRRFAGREMELSRSLRIGDRLTRRSTIAELVEKTGRNGPMVFVTVLHEIFAQAELAHIERQKIVYLGAPTAGVAEKKQAAPELPQAEWMRIMRFDPVMLFRYSALTFNAHRIHYDRDYATASEGYPGLVVNGGLTTLFLLETARHHLSAPIAGYAMRARNVLFAGDEVRLCGAQTATGAATWALDARGDLAMQVDVTTGQGETVAGPAATC